MRYPIRILCLMRGKSMADSKLPQIEKSKSTLEGNRLVLDLGSMRVDEYFDRTTKESFITNEAIVELSFRKYCDAIKWRTDLIGVLGLFLAIILALVTGTFKDSFGISSSIWLAIFFILLVSIIIFFLFTMAYTFLHRHDAKIENVVKTLKDRSLGRK